MNEGMKVYRSLRLGYPISIGAGYSITFPQRCSNLILMGFELGG